MMCRFIHDRPISILLLPLREVIFENVRAADKTNKDWHDVKKIRLTNLACNLHLSNFLIASLTEIP